MRSCITAQYTPQALNSIMENPAVNRPEVIKKLLETAGGKLISMYSTDGMARKEKSLAR